MAAPPLLTGTTYDTTSCPDRLFRVAVTEVGAPGTVAGTTAQLAEAAPNPAPEVDAATLQL
jgi:hypothetical protein